MRFNDRGAAAVEFALIVPVLLSLVLGMMVFGRAYQVQSSLSMAAREAVRVMALDPDHDIVTAKAAATTAASSLGVTGAVNPTAAGCTEADPNATVIITHNFNFIGVSLNLSGKGVMRCGG